MDRTDFISLLDVRLPDNLAAKISANDARDILEALALSVPFLDGAKIGLNDLGSDVIGLMSGGRDPTKWKGAWNPATNLPAIPVASVAVAGNWYQCSEAGTPTGNASAVGACNKYDYLRCLPDGSAWSKELAPIAVVGPGSITVEHLTQELRWCFIKVDHPEFAYMVTDAVGNLAFAIRHDNTCYGIFDIGPNVITLDKLGSDVVQLIANPGDGVHAFSFTDSIGQMVFGCDLAGNLLGVFPIENGAVVTSKIADLAVTRTKLSADVQACLPAIVDNDRYAVSWTDQLSYIAMAIKYTGGVEIPGLELPPAVILPEHLSAGCVTGPKLGADVLLPTVCKDPSVAVAFVDEQEQIGMVIRQDTRIEGNFVCNPDSISSAMLQAAVVTEPKIAPDIRRIILPNDYQIAPHDNLWRGTAVDIPQGTHESGTAWSRFPWFDTPILYGVNDTGTSIEFRRASGLVVRGTRFRGNWVVFSGAPDTAPLPGDFWNVTGGGTFNGVPYGLGDRLVSLGIQFNGVALGPKWHKQKNGEYYDFGGFTPAGFSPLAPRPGDLYTADAAGTFDGKTFAIGDTLFRISSGWGHIPAVRTVIADGAIFQFSTDTAADYEFRRVDKSTTPVWLTARGYTTSLPRRHKPGVVMFGDSLVATNGLSTKLAAKLAPRVLTARSYNGASSTHILTMIRDYIRNGGDPYKAQFHWFYHGANNSGNQLLTRRAALEMAGLVGARDGRLGFISFPGQRVMLWNGTRLWAPVHEEAFQETGDLYGLEQWYETTFQGRFISARQVLLAAAAGRTERDPQFPGMTEAEVATTYGALPLSFFFDFSLMPWTRSALTFKGYKSTAGLPTGGASGDYWLRNGPGGAFVGSLIVNWEGAWSETQYDVTHPLAEATTILADAIFNYHTTNNL